MYLEAINLSKKYGNFYALRNLNLRVEGENVEYLDHIQMVERKKEVIKNE